MKQKTARRRKAFRYLHRERKAGRIYPYYTEAYGAEIHMYGTTRAADKRLWGYCSKRTIAILSEEFEWALAAQLRWLEGCQQVAGGRSEA